MPFFMGLFCPSLATEYNWILFQKPPEKNLPAIINIPAVPGIKYSLTVYHRIILGSVFLSLHSSHEHEPVKLKLAPLTPPGHEKSLADG